MPPVRTPPGISDIWLFSNCTKSELRAIRSSATPASLVTGQLVIKEGEPGTYFFVIVNGAAEVRRKGRPVARLGPGDYFGELSLLDGKPHAASVICTSDVEVLVVSRRGFDKVLLSVPTIARKIMRTMAARLRESDARSYA